MIFTYTNELYHHGIKGQKWGVRRYQNEDGSLTAKGIKRYDMSSEAQNKARSEKYLAEKNAEKSSKPKMSTAKKVAIGAAVVAVAAGVTYVAIKAKNNKAVGNGMQAVNNALNRSTSNGLNRPGLAGAMDATSGLSRSSAPKPSAAPSQVSRYTNNNLKRITTPTNSKDAITKLGGGKTFTPLTAAQRAKQEAHMTNIRAKDKQFSNFVREYERRAKNVPDTTDFLRRYGMSIDDYNWITRH